ncbi:MAG TPA: hypothetical protein VFJ30_18235 [Phycisphaerae bacterium]|nr:hypothetical protein [Phycisphaerae bacterium]
MAPTHDNYEQVARFLDGEPVSLTPPQRALAEEIAAAERSLGAKLDADLPPAALHRIYQRIQTALPSRRPAWRRARWVSATAAVAAALAFALLWQPQTESRPEGLARAEYVQAFLDVPEGGLEAEVRELSEEVAEYHVGLSVGETVGLEIAVDALELELGETAEEPDPDVWGFWEDPL